MKNEEHKLQNPATIPCNSGSGTAKLASSYETWGSVGFGAHDVGVYVYVSYKKDKELLDCPVNGAAEGIAAVLKDWLIKSEPGYDQLRKEYAVLLLSMFNPYPIFYEFRRNEYNNDPLHPWIKVTTPLGHFVVGRRKPVFQINYTETLIDWLSELSIVSDNKRSLSQNYGKFVSFPLPGSKIIHVTDIHTGMMLIQDLHKFYSPLLSERLRYEPSPDEDKDKSVSGN